MVMTLEQWCMAEKDTPLLKFHEFIAKGYEELEDETMRMTHALGLHRRGSSQRHPCDSSYGQEESSAAYEDWMQEVKPSGRAMTHSAKNQKLPHDDTATPFMYLTPKLSYIDHPAIMSAKICGPNPPDRERLYLCDGHGASSDAGAYLLQRLMTRENPDQRASAAVCLERLRELEGDGGIKTCECPKCESCGENFSKCEQEGVRK
ncbi:unnamed protein product [Clonostachys rhizophaga]|uniref:Uncharacterized protein n=1 Tax=Clonostachys rhizophaga TaxID=160324 RepID=A0A9N9VDA4_9HYPO|nr:unnamed protein product [Clonostachys rhizophaga]